MSVVRHREEHYAPWDDVKAFLDRLPLALTVSGDLEIYGFTDRLFAMGLIDAARRGVRQRWILDQTQEHGPKEHALVTELWGLICAEHLPVEIRIGQSAKHNIIHNKMLIGEGAAGAADDASFVVKGSYNFSDSAQSQVNFVVWDNDPGVVQAAMDAFERDWAAGVYKPEWQLAAA